MSKALDTLGKTVEQTATTSAGTVISKEQLIDLVSDRLAALYNVSQFFTALESCAGECQKKIIENRRNASLKSMQYYNQICSQLTGGAKRAMDERFLGAMVDTTNALITILEEVSGNIGQFFENKSITLYSTKISHVAIFGMIDTGKTFAEFCEQIVNVMMSDLIPQIGTPAKYTFSFIQNNMVACCNLMNSVINSHLSKTFTAALLKYRNGGSDVKIVNSENKATVQFAKITNEVTERDINAGCRGLAIFRWFGNRKADKADRVHRKNVALREQLQARARLLQLELDGTDQNSPEYKRLVKIIENYQNQIDRLTQEIDKYEKE